MYRSVRGSSLWVLASSVACVAPPPETPGAAAAHLMKGKGAEFDPKTAWELRLSIWSGTPRNFDMYIDDIAFEK